MMLSINPAQAKIYRIDVEQSKVYCGSDEIIAADSKTFTVVDHDFAKDKNHVYLGGEILQDADPDTFVRLSTDRSRVNRDDYQIISYGYSKDKNHVYFWNKRINNADSASFKERAYGYAEDKNYIYHHENIYQKKTEELDTFFEPEYAPRMDK